MAITGAAVRWLRDNLGIIKSAPEVGKSSIHNICDALNRFAVCNDTCKNCSLSMEVGFV